MRSTPTAPNKERIVEKVYSVGAELATYLVDRVTLKQPSKVPRLGDHRGRVRLL